MGSSWLRCSRRFDSSPRGDWLKRFKGLCFVKVEYSVKLARKARVKIMTLALAAGQVDHADSSFKEGIFEGCLR